MTDELRKIVSEMKQLAEKEPFRMSAYNPICPEKMARKVAIDDGMIDLVFTLDEYPMVPNQIWHLTVSGEISDANLKELVKTFYPTGPVIEVPPEEIVQLGVLTEQEVGNQRQFCQIKM